MKIIWHGHSCFQIESSPQKNEKPISLVIDPFSEEIGLKLPKMEADILLVTHEHYDHNNIKGVLGSPFLITAPGEYELKKIFIQGISSFHDNVGGSKRGKNTIYIIEVEKIKVCHLGDLGQTELSAEQLEKIGEVDVLILPVGGTYTIGAKEVPRIISQIEPKIVIPMHYQLPKIKIKLDTVDSFLKTIGKKEIKPQDKLKIQKKDLDRDGFEVVVLTPK